MLQQLFVSSSHYRSEECNYINVATFKKHSLILCIQVKKPKIYFFSTSISHFCTLHIGTVTNFQHFCSPGTLSIKNALCIRYGWVSTWIKSCLAKLCRWEPLPTHGFKASSEGCQSCGLLYPLSQNNSDRHPIGLHHTGSLIEEQNNFSSLILAHLKEWGQTWTLTKNQAAF